MAGGYGKSTVSCPAPGNLIVTVLDSLTRKPIQGVDVRVAGPKPGRGITTQAGQYKHLSIPPGAYTCRIATLANLPAYADAEILADHPKTVEISAGSLDFCVLMVAPKAKLRVKAIRSDTAAVIAQCGLSFSGPQAIPNAITPSGAGIWQSDPFTPGEYTVTLGLPAVDPQTFATPAARGVKIAPSTNPLLLFLVDPLAQLEVTVINDYDNSKVDLVDVILGGDASATVESKNGGVADFDPLVKGNYEITVAVKPDKAPLFRDMPPVVKFSLKPGEVKKLEIKITPKILELTHVDDWFAPSAETNDFEYKIYGLWDLPVKLTISSALYTSGPIYEVDLQDPQKANNAKQPYPWDGKTNCASGSLKDLYIHPLLSPYKVTLYHNDQLKSEKEFKVLYHSIKLHRGPWTPDEQEPPKSDQAKWAQYKLNDLGYWGGPVGKDTQDYLKKAVVRYKANHKSLVKLDYNDYDATIDATLEGALDAGDNKVECLQGGDAASDPSATTKVFVEAITYVQIGATTEFATAKKHEKEAERVNRPLIPIEADIYIKKKGGDAAMAPDAVGPCRISWRFKDPQEDVSTQYSNTPAEPSYTKSYILDSLKKKGGRTGDENNNCHSDFAGIRTDAGYYKAAFLLGDNYLPYTAADDSGQKVVFSNACIDKTTYPKRMGKAGIFYRPSIIAGDQFKLKAEIDFTGLPNKDALEGFHGTTSLDTRINKETGIFQNWRRNAIVLLINWPERKSPPAAFATQQWAGIRDEYLKAYHDIDVAGIATKKITDVLTEADYRKAVQAVYPAILDADITLYEDTVYGLATPVQGASKPDQYRLDLGTKTNGGFWGAVSTELRKTLSKNIRPSYPNGFVIVDCLSHKPVDIYDDAAAPAVAASPAAPTLPTITSLTTVPAPPTADQACTFTIQGTNFDLATASVVFSKAGSAVTVANASLTAKTATQLDGSVVLPGGNYTVNVKSGTPELTSAGFALKVPVEKGFVAWTFSVGLPDSVIYADQKDPDKTYYVLGHEMGHNLFLQHWENTGNITYADHDNGDHNCIMSYSSSNSAWPVQKPGVFTPHFCGKCNLKLRGWDVQNLGLSKVNPDTQADLVFSISFSNAAPKEGDEFDIVYSVQNNGPANVTALKAHPSFPWGMTDSVSFTGDGTFPDANDAWDIGAVANGATKTMTVRRRVKAGQATLEFEAALSLKSVAETVTANTRKAKGHVEGADLRLVLTPAKLDPKAGEDVVTGVQVINYGPDPATAITVDLSPPAGLTLKDGNLGGALNVATGIWTAGNLAVLTQTMGRTIKLMPNLGQGGNTLKFEGQISAAILGVAPMPGKRYATFSFTVPAESADLAVTAVPADPSGAAADWVWTLVTLTNNGPDPASAITVSLTPSDFYQALAPSSGNLSVATATNLAAATFQWTLGNLSSGASATLDVALYCRTAGVAVTLAVTAAAAQPDPVPGNNAANASITVT